MTARRMLIDAGNTRLKWLVVENGVWREQGSVDYTDLPALHPVLRTVTDCVIASVAGAALEKQLGSCLALFDIAPKWLLAEAAFRGMGMARDVNNGYANPQQLGVDRWMGLIAARQRTQGPALVVSAGTAMTVDALSAEGIFLGGLIVPGMSLMRRALRQGTARVADVTGASQAFPRTTADAVHSGIVAALCGAIQVQYSRLAEAAGGAPLCFLSGGDAASLLPHLAIPVDLAPALALEGMDWVVRMESAAR